MNLGVNYKKYYEYILIPLLFIASFFNQALCFVFTLSLIPLLHNKEQGALKIILLVSVRSIINPYFTKYFEGDLGIFKWIILFMCSTIIVIFSYKEVLKSRKIRIVLWLFLVLTVYIVVQSLAFSSYPIVSIAKFASYSFVFFAILMGVSKNSDIDWLGYLCFIFSTLLFISCILLFIPSIGYMKNGVGFQGVFNQPNMMGIMCPLILTCFLKRKTGNNIFIDILFTLIILLFAYLSKSRTGMFSIVAIFILIFATSKKMSPPLKIVLGCLGITLFCIIYFASYYVQDAIGSVIFKGGNSFLFSRQGQVLNFLEKMKYNAFFGTGFLTPFRVEIKSFIFSFDLIVEDGNILMATLGYVGIIGFVLFCILYGFIFSCNKDKRNWLLFFIPIIISLGEMTFFSTNNLGCLFYVFYAVYMFPYCNNKESVDEIPAYGVIEARQSEYVKIV